MRKMRIDRLYKRTSVIFAISLVIAGLVYLLFEISILKHLELKTVDYRFRKFNISAQADTNIVIIAIDDNSLEYFTENNVSWPWPRDFYAIFTDYLTDNGAENIIFDMLFNQPDVEREETDANYTDGLFAASIRKNKNVILAAKLNVSEKKSKINLAKFTLKISGLLSPKIYNSGIFPLEKFLKNAKQIGIINVSPDSDGIIRRVPFFYRVNDFVLSQIGLTPFLNSNPIRVKNNKIVLNNWKIPLDKNGNYFINWYAENSFKYVTFSSVIQSAFAKKYGGNQTLPSQMFAGKTILIGSTASGIDDLISVPFADPIPGVELWATVISNIHTQNFALILTPIMNFLILLLTVFLTILLFLKIKSRLSVPILILLPIGIILLNFLLFSELRIVATLTIPLAGFIFAFIYSSLTGYFIEGKSRKELRRIFSRYLHPLVIDQILNNPEKIKLGGASIEASVLFSDIADFTTFSEDKTAEELIRLLNIYFEKLTDFVLSNNGLLDKYTGDGIMAIFGAPISMKRHAFYACKAALAHKKFSETDSSEVASLHENTRIGINSGIIVAGNLGSERKTDYTAIGDDVNLASRLEGVNKVYKTKIIIGDSTFRLVKHDFICRELDKLRVKGKIHPTSVYELIDEKTGNEKLKWIAEYESGLHFYQKGEWDNAIEKFKLVLKEKEDDYPAKLMLNRCETLKKENPKNWDGVISLKTK